ncbi:Thymidylate kinase [Flexibacter flexilis DSM 6793]|uniref:Thymidylate kinase n=1 Tax=Flexibacter flexilis DSM 6793 TaxID=927664 RepID=A0A1I1LC50_9BACT|nr:hypothetical protein [Flexibacter flexilis]SFC67100.1 Thymidylate kinase [Flexibacter flexilis DSM 6793]
MEDFLFALGLSLKKTREGATPICFYYIPNTDGSIRWFWNEKATQPHFLKFYHTADWRSRLIAAFYHLVFFFKLQHLLFAKNQILAYIADMNKIVGSDAWTDVFVFTGTAGPNRKLTLFLRNQQGKSFFVKQAISSNSLQLIEREKTTLSYLNHISLSQSRIPSVAFAGSTFLMFVNESAGKTSTDRFGAAHQIFLEELHHQSVHLANTSKFLKLENLDRRLELLGGTKVPVGIVKKLNTLAKDLANEQSNLMLSYAHGDFTPWNMFVDAQGKLFVYDWELFRKAYPEGFDFIHFIVQKGILIERKNWAAIKEEIYNTYAEYQGDMEISIDQQLKWYLLLNTLNQLEIFAAQAQWHTQVNWLLNTWNDALSDILSAKHQTRPLIIRDLFDWLSAKQYGTLKLELPNVELLPVTSDLDICLNRADALQAFAYFSKHSLVAKLIVVKGFTVSRVTLLLRDGGILHVDFIHQWRRKYTQFGLLGDVLAKTHTDAQGIRHVSPYYTAVFVGCFYGLNKSQIPFKYLHYSQFLEKSRSSLDNQIYGLYLGDRANPARLTRYLQKRIYNQGFSAFLCKVQYWLDVASRLITTKGFTVTFSGVDGAGKSTVIAHLREELDKKFRRRVVVLRHRPSFLPILSAYKHGKTQAEQIAANTLPRQGQNTSVISSLFRFGYYYIDYLFGQFVVYFKYILRGYIVLYDRYYFDFINDSKRSNIYLPKWFLKMGYFFLKKPELNFFLYAQAQEILKRKQELNENTIRSLTSDYLGLFESLSKDKNAKYIALENNHLPHTLQHISGEIKNLAY